MAGYDFERSHLYLATADGIVFDLAIRPHITIIGGDSGTGKTLLCNLITEAKKPRNGAALGMVDVSNVRVVDSKPSLKEAISCDGVLTIIDYADDILGADDVEAINQDTRNHYIVFARRAHGFRVTPNYVGSFVREGKTVRIEYMADVQGWF